MALPMKLRTVFTNHRVYFTFSRLSHHHNVRVRFAPSPTGMLHLGGLRTALLNYLFAKSHSGKFVLRIEDTDLTRIVPGAVEKLEQMLQWAGLYPDESPSIGGPYEPYLQSERFTLYNESKETLMKSGHCYRCFCTERRLSLLRKEAARRGEIPKYDNKCRHLTQSEVEEKLSQNTPYVIRFKYEPLESAWVDLVYGSMHEKSIGQSLEGDFVVVKSDGYPTYHFANVVDDHYMQISHVLRGEEWSISTPKHLQMYEAFGWEPPHYAHLPLILNSDGTKLSKRQGDIRVDIFKDKNYYPNAVLNYLTTVNKGFTEDTAGKTLDEMVNIFSLDTLNTHSARLQPEKLKELSATHLQRRFNSEQLKPDVIKETQNLLKERYKERVYNSHVLDNNYIENVLTWALDEKLSNEAVSGVPKRETYEASVKLNETFEDLEYIPAPPVIEQRTGTRSYDLIRIDKNNIIVFDLETTGLAHDSCILQIAAQHFTSGDRFSSYVQPEIGYIPDVITEITGIELCGDILHHHDVPVSAVNIRYALQTFQQWIDKYSKPVLVAHNAQFDSKVLVHSFQAQKMSFPDIGGFADSLKLFRTTHPGLESYKQQFLVHHLLRKNYTAHDAVSDASALSELMNLVPEVEQKLQVFTTEDVMERLQKLTNERQNMCSYAKLIHLNVITKSCAKTLASSGLNENHLRTTYKQHGVEGLNNLLKDRYKYHRKLSESLNKFYKKIM